MNATLFGSKEGNNDCPICCELLRAIACMKIRDLVSFFSKCYIDSFENNYSFRRKESSPNSLQIKSSYFYTFYYRIIMFQLFVVELLRSRLNGNKKIERARELKLDFQIQCSFVSNFLKRISFYTFFHISKLLIKRFQRDSLSILQLRITSPRVYGTGNKKKKRNET